MVFDFFDVIPFHFQRIEESVEGGGTGGDFHYTHDARRGSRAENPDRDFDAGKKWFNQDRLPIAAEQRRYLARQLVFRSTASAIANPHGRSRPGRFRQDRKWQ